ncbi:ArsR/SmtB family transcription factor [Sporolactobacillus pectinivorans]|uniref:ArsR/SmtB family transcription factor n=1 Tax=Sporolactobacillus pectinivorans TaxID=1591408 RepID=UPI000C268D39|nr:helix-turn-helix transcriptional regulator [Sporolactobacillus pectinivorans]
MRPLIHPNIEDINLEQLLYALSDPTRLQIVTRLYNNQGEQSCSHFEDLGKKSNLSHHYRTLRENGLIHIRRNGRNSFLSLRKTELNKYFPNLIGSIMNIQKEMNTGK